MGSVRAHLHSSPAQSGPAWEIAELFPDQGDLSEGDYLRLTDYVRRLVEFTDGRIEVLPMPTLEHQDIILFLVNLLRVFIGPQKMGRATMSPYRVRLGKGRYREPDVVFMLERNAARMNNRYSDGADLVMEVINEDGAKRDLIEKPEDYAAAGISEYWIVDPRSRQIKVLRLENGRYITHSEATASGEVDSALLAGFTADVAAVFAAGR